MNIQVNDFRWEPGKNDAEYIKLLESSRDEWQKIAQKAIAKLKTLSKAQEPRVMALEEVKQCVYGMPYIIETNKPREGPRLMYGLYSHKGVNGCFYFAFTDARSHFFDADYGIRWRCWTSCPDEKRRADTPWG